MHFAPVNKTIRTQQSAGVSEGSDLGVRQTGEQSQQGGEEVFVVYQAVPTGANQNPNELTQAGFESLQLNTLCA